MSITERLYYTDSHLIEFDARVVRLTETADKRPAILLDRTAFYPTGGGQPSDTGTLDGARVVECIDLEAEGVLHVIEGATLAEGAPVRGRVDWSRRLEHIQQHTAQHILSQAFIQLFDAPTRSFRITATLSEIDLELPDPTLERIERAVDLANQIIWEDRPLKIHQLTPEAAAQLPLRKDPARAGELRIVEIENFDFNACGGTHARRTGEVGLVAVRAWERAKGMTRLEFVAGTRALADYRRANGVARTIAALFSVARDDAPAHVERTLEENRRLTRRVRALEEITIRVEAAELLAAAQMIGDTRLVVHTIEGRDADSLKRLALALIEQPATVALLGSRDGDAARLVFARAADAPGDMNGLMREACAHIGGRGGGRPDMAQGGGPLIERLADALAAAALSVAPPTQAAF